MGKLDTNSAVGVLHGKVRDLIFVRMKDGTVYVRRVADRKAPVTSAELASREKFRKAAAYVRSVRHQPDIYAVYEAAARTTSKRACDLAHADFRYPPEIHDIDLSGYTGKPGDLIQIHAVDDFGVARVIVSITGLDSAPLEQGFAVLDRVSGRWQYTTTLLISQAVIIHVTALDRPGNSASKSVHHVLLD